MAMSVRKAEEGDAQAACALIRRSILDLCQQDHGGDALTLEGWLCNKTPENMAFWITNPGTHVFIAERDGVIAGVGAVTDYGEILLAYVEPAQRFKGVTHALLKEMEATCRGGIVERMSLTSTETARDFFLGRGYQLEEEEGDAFAETELALVKNLR